MPISTFFDDSNTAAVQSGPPPRPTDFTLSQPTLVAHAWTYHYHAHPLPPFPAGTISFKNTATGAVFGPYPAKGSAGQGGGLDNWDTEPNVVLPAGPYQIIDSDPSTWSWNATSADRGFALLDGEPTTMGSPRPIINNWNTAQVFDNPQNITRFTLSQSTLITTIDEYHWNGGHGVSAVGITVSSALAFYGPFPATGSKGTGGNLVNWQALLNIVLPPGTYEVGSTSHQTWSWNAGSGGAGFALVNGV